MRSKLNKITLAAGIAFALAFTLSCSSDIELPPPPENPQESSDSSSSTVSNGSSSSTIGTISSSSNNGGVSSSSSAMSSSSSFSQSDVYCQVGGTCSFVPKDACSAFQGIEVFSCGGSSSSSHTSSSSSSISSSSVGGFGSSSSSSSAGGFGGTYSSSQSSSSHQPIVIPGASVSYGGETYETVVIGTQTWFKRNLNYNPSTGNSACYNNEESNCSTYGRLYDWSTAMGFDAACNSYSVVDANCNETIGSPHQGICPDGWHIPSNDDWDALMTAVGGYSTAGKHLKATNGMDTYGFSALLGGSGSSGDSFSGVGGYGYWWSSSEVNSYDAYCRYMYYYSNDADYYRYDKYYLFSVRCVKDLIL